MRNGMVVPLRHTVVVVLHGVYQMVSSVVYPPNGLARVVGRHGAFRTRFRVAVGALERVRGDVSVMLHLAASSFC